MITKIYNEEERNSANVVTIDIITSIYDSIRINGEPPFELLINDGKLIGVHLH